MSLPDRTAAAKRWKRMVALTTIAALVLSVGATPESIPGKQGFPLDGLRWLLDDFRNTTLPAVGGLPEQTRGGDPGAGAATDTSVHRGAGQPPGHGIGALPEYRAPAQEGPRTGGPGTTPTLPGDASYDPKLSQRIAGAATEKSDVYANPDGSYTRKVHQQAVNYRGSRGEWTPIDATLVRGADGRYRQKANAVATDLAPRADDPRLAELNLDAGHGMSYSLAGAAPAEAHVDGDTVLYRGVLPGVDLLFEARPTSTKESLVLHSADAPTSYLFPLRLRGLTAALETDGSVTLRDPSGAVRVTIPAGYMTDSKFDNRSGSFARSNGVRYELVDGPALKVSIDEAWLRDKDRVFPVTVDPTVALDGSADTYAYSTQPGNNSGDNELLAGTWNGSAKAHSFVHFSSFGTTFGGARMTGVSLKIFDSWAATCTPKPFTVHPVTSSWTSQGVTAYPGPSFGPSIGSVTANPGAACTNTAGNRAVGTWMTVPLQTATFQSWALGGVNHGLAVSASQTDITQWKRFTSLNGPANLGPYLQVTYAPGMSPQVDDQFPPNGHAATTLTPELLVAAHDPDAFPNPLTYDFAVYDKGGAKLASSGWTSSRKWVVPAGVLAWGQTYHWTVVANDGYSTSVSQTTNLLTTPVPQPLITSGLAQNGGQGFEPSVANYTTAATDASVETVGPALAVTRSYNSQDPRTGFAFGAGWSSIVDTKATEQRDNGGTLRTVMVTYPGGQDVVFGRNHDGTFAPPLGRYATFAALAGGGYRLVDKDGTAYTFTAATGAGVFGVTSIADAQGRTETFAHDASGRLTTMTAASGRSLRLTWTTPAGATAAHVDTVTTDGDAAIAQVWRYGYDGDLLTRVCPPTSATACTTYTYGTGSLHPTTVLNAGPRSYWRLGEASGTQAASAVLDNFGTDVATYHDVTLGQPGPLPGSAGTAAAFNGTSSTVDLPAQLVSTATRLTVGLWFKAAAGDQGPLFSYQADPIGNGTTAGNYTPALYIGTSGRLHGQFWDGGAVPMSSTGPVADGRWHHVVLAGEGNQQWLYLDGALIGTKSGVISTVDAFSAANEYLGAGFLGGDWPDEPHASTTDDTGHASYFKGLISDAVYFDRALTGPDVTTLHRTGTAAARPLTSVVRPSGNASATVVYDAVTGSVRQVTDANGGVWKLNQPRVSGSSKVYASTVLGADAADYWRLAETGTTDAINEVHGTTASYSGVALGVAGGPFPDTTVAGFDGTRSNVRLAQGYLPAGGPHSIGLWFRTTTTNRTLFSHQADPITTASATANYTPVLYVGNSGKLVGQFWQGDGGTFSSTKVVNDDRWHHVVLAAGATGQSMYLDGELVGTKTGTVAVTGQGNVHVGAGFLGGKWPDQNLNTTGTTTAYPTYFKGQIAEVAFYRSQLTAAQVATQYAARDAAGGVPARTVTVTDPTNKTITHVYDVGTGRALATVDTLGGQTRYGYDEGGFLRTVTDPNGDVTTTEHDVRGNTVSSTTCQDRPGNKCSTVYFTYYPDATTKVLTPDPRNDVLLTERDGRSASATDNAYLTSYAYDAAGNRTTVTDPLGRVTRTGYTDGTTVAAFDGGLAPPGLPMTLTTAGGATQTVVYYRTGDVARVTDPAGKVTTYTYDVLGRVATSTETTDSHPSGLVTRYSYDKLNRLVSQTDPAVTNRVTGAVHTRVTTTTYDADGLVTSVSTADTTGGDATRTEHTTYTATGQPATATDAAGKVTRFQYDVYGNLVKETGPDGTAIGSAYDSEGNLLTTTLLGFTGDPADPSPAADLPLETCSYDAAGRLAAQTDAMGWVTEYRYTDNGLLARQTRRDPRTGATFVLRDDTFDAAGNLVASVTANGTARTTFTVDAAGRTTSSTFDPAGLKRTATYTYSRDDHVIGETLTDPSGLVSSTDTMVDPLGRVVAETRHTGALTPVARYRLDGSAADSAGNSPGTAQGVTWSTDRGGAAVLDGTGGAVTTAGPVLDTAASFTVAAWVNLAGTGADRTAVGASGSQQDAFELRYDNSINRWRFVMRAADTAGAASTAVASTAAPAVNTWTHLAAVHDAASGTMRLYVNGALQGSATAAGSFTARGPLLLGAGLTDGARGAHWSGGISDVQLYSRVLTTAEIAAVTAGTAPAAGAGVVRTGYRLDQDGLPRSVTDPNGNVTDLAYDEDGRLAVTTGPAVATERNGGAPVVARPVTLAGFNTFGEQTEELDPSGNLVVTGYDAVGRELWTRLPSYTPPGSSTVITPVTTSTYDDLGRLTSTTDGLGRVTRYAYDQLGRAVSVTQPNGGVRRTTYNAGGDPLTETDATGATAAATWDFLGRQETSTQAVRQNGATYTTRYAYGANGLLATETSPAGTVARTAYNAAGEPVTVTDPAGNATTHAYDGAGRQTRTTLPDGTFSTVTYDLADRPVADSDFDAAGTLLRRTTHRYDAAGNLLASTDPRGTTASFTYDAAGLLRTQSEPVSAGETITTSFGYDAAGNRTRFTDGRGNALLTTYNSWNLPESTIEPATTAYPGLADRTFTIAYDANGEPAKMSLPGGASIGFTYDTMGNLTRQTGTGAEVATAERAFGYDLAGRLVAAAAQDGTNTFTYDDRSLLLSAAGPSGASTFTYTADGLTASRADAAGTTTYGYDTAGRLSTVSNPGAGVQATLSYNTLSQVRSIGYGTGASTRTFGYDALHRIVSDEVKTAGSATVARIAYGYDLNDNLTSKTTTGFAGSAANTYTYDLANRLTSWSNGSTTTAYAYDRSGNRIQAGARTFAYDQRNQLTSGNDGTWYQYTARGTLKAALANGATLTTQADAFGQVLTQDATGDGRRTYTYDAFGRALRPGFAYTGTGNDLAADDSGTYVRDPDADVVAATSGAAQRLVWTDLHDDVVGQFTPTGTALAGSTTYDPLGLVVTTAGQVGSLGYQSEWTDGLTGRVNMAARWYNPGTGQFDTRDTADVSPVPQSIRANRYAYGDGNPLTVTDPTGHWGLGSVLKKAWKATKRVVTNTVRKVVQTVRKVVHKVKKVVQKVVKKVKQAVSKARKWVSHKVAQVKKKVKQVYNKAKQAGKKVVAKVKRTVKKAAKSVSDAYHATATWVKDHKNAIIEVAAIGAGILGGLACTAVTGGVGAVACMAGAAAIINVAKDAAQGNIHNWGDLLQSAGTGALMGVAGGVGGFVGGRIAGAVAGKLGPLAGSLLGRVVTGAAGGATADVVTQLITTRRVDLKSVAFSAAVGGVFGARYKGKADEPDADSGNGAGRGGEGAPPGGVARDGRANADQTDYVFSDINETAFRRGHAVGQGMKSAKEIAQNLTRNLDPPAVRDAHTTHQTSMQAVDSSPAPVVGSGGDVFTGLALGAAILGAAIGKAIGKFGSRIVNRFRRNR